MSCSLVLCSIALDVINTLKCASRIRTDPQELELLLLELTSLTTTMLPHEQRLSFDSEAPLQDISFLEPAVLDCNTKLEQAWEVLKRCCDFISKGGSRFKDRHKGWGWQEMKIVREQIDGVRGITERLRMEMVHKQIDGLREGMERLRKDLRSHTSKSPIPAEERVDYLFILQSDHQCNPITHSMRNTCTAIVSAPNRLNINISINKGFCDNSVKSTLNGGLFPIQVAETKYNHQIYDSNEAFPQLESEQTLHQALLKRKMFEIASALVWLHEEHHLFGKLDRYLAHLDLKPENILLAHDNHAGTSASHHPAGKWMLTDFGVSVFDKATNQKATRTHSIRDVGPRLTSRANMDEVMRGHGPYQPPEVDLDTVDGRKCDVWSLACILCDVLAFAFGRGRALHTYLATLHKTEDPHRGFFKHRMTTRNTAAHPRPVSDLKRLCWEPEANSESRTCPQHPAFPDSKLEHFLHRIRKALPLNISSLVVLLSPLLFAPSVGALAPGCVGTHDRVSWVQALRSTQRDLISLWTYPLSLSEPPLEPATDPMIILLATFLSTSAIALAAQAGKNDIYQPHIVGFCALVSVICATGLGVGLREFVFGYLFWACVAGVGGSWVAHRAMAAGRRGLLEKGEGEGEKEGI